MKRTVNKLRLRAETIRHLPDLRSVRGGVQCYTVSALICPNTWCASCGESCTTGLDTT